MTKNKIEVYMKGGENGIYVNGIKYMPEKITYKKMDGIEHTDRVIYSPVNKDFEKNKQIIVEELLKHTDSKELMNQLINNTVGVKTAELLSNKIKKNATIKKHKGCLGFKVGNKYLQVIE